MTSAATAMEALVAKEDQLTRPQKDWLEASRKIGPGAMTKSERLLLEELYAKMLPREQQELMEYIQEEFGSKESSEDGDTPVDEPTYRMEQREWAEPSEGLRKALGKAQRSPFGSDREMH